MEYTVYAIRSLKDESIYVGMSSDVSTRVGYHNLGYVFSTKGHRPYVLIFTEECSDRIEARKREKYWKSGIGKEKLKNIPR